MRQGLNASARTSTTRSVFHRLPSFSSTSSRDFCAFQNASWSMGGIFDGVRDFRISSMSTCGSHSNGATSRM